MRPCRASTTAGAGLGRRPGTWGCREWTAARRLYEGHVPRWVGCPVVAIVVEDGAALGQAIGAVLASPDEYAPRSQAARQALAKAQGATARYLAAILDEPQA